MAKKGDRYYFDNFIACVECSHRATTLLGATFILIWSGVWMHVNMRQILWKR